MEDWEEREREAMSDIEEEHEGLKAARELGNKLQKHYNPQTGAYHNDPAEAVAEPVTKPAPEPQWTINPETDS